MESSLKLQNEALQISDDIAGMVKKLSKPELVAFLYLSGYPSSCLDVDHVDSDFTIDYFEDGHSVIARMYYEKTKFPVVATCGTNVYIAMLGLFGEVFGKARKARKVVSGSWGDL